MDLNRKNRDRVVVEVNFCDNKSSR